MGDEFGVDLGIEGIEGAVPIGHGGFGTVYRAVQPAYRRTVAVKVLSLPLRDEPSRSAFDKECQALGSLSSHPNIVTLHQAGVTPHSQPYLIMEYLPGGSLAARVASGPLAWSDAVVIGVKLAGALATAHRAGVLHRDVKPDNVLFSEYGEPQLADFGVARLFGATRTATGAFSGSITHAAPETLSGMSASAASDVWSLASTIATAIAGSPPFGSPTKASLQALITSILTADPIDLRSLSTPEPVCAAVEAGLAKDSWERPSTMDAFGSSLQEAQRLVGVPVTPMTVRNAAVAPPTPLPSRLQQAESGPPGPQPRAETLRRGAAEGLAVPAPDSSPQVVGVRPTATAHETVPEPVAGPSEELSSATPVAASLPPETLVTVGKPPEEDRSATPAGGQAPLRPGEPTAVAIGRTSDPRGVGGPSKPARSSTKLRLAVTGAVIAVIVAVVAVALAGGRGSSRTRSKTPPAVAAAPTSPSTVAPTTAATTVTTAAAATSGLATTSSSPGIDDYDGDGTPDRTCGIQDFRVGLVLRIPCQISNAHDPDSGTVLVQNSLYRLPGGVPGFDLPELDSVSAEAIFARDVSGNKVLVAIINSDALFDVGSATLTDAAGTTLSGIISAIKNHFPTAAIQVRGHTDATGAPDLNQRLSEARAAAARSFLTTNGLEPAKVTAVGLGSSEPLVDEQNLDGSDNATGRHTNRRVEIVIHTGAGPWGMP